MGLGMRPPTAYSLTLVVVRRSGDNNSNHRKSYYQLKGNMASGGPGDHPITDILLYDLEVYGEDIDGLIKEISKYISSYKLYDMFSEIIGFSPSKKQLKKIKLKLTERLQDLKIQAEKDGWEKK